MPKPNSSPEPWIIPPLWENQTVIVVGGGASLRGFDFESLRGRNLIALNAAGYDLASIAQETDLLFGHDGHFFISNPELVRSWPGLIATISEQAVKAYHPRIHFIRTREMRDFVRNQLFVKRGRSSGHTGVSIAIAGGARRLILLGYDMKMINGQSHYHGRYGHVNDRIFRADFMPRFSGWDAAARRAHVDVFNASPGTALLEFRRGHLSELLEL